MSKILIWGVGYVGLVTACAFSEAGHEVYCYDIEYDKLAKIAKGISSIYETGIDRIVAKKQLHPVASISHLIGDPVSFPVDFIFVCVGTPSNEDGSVNLDWVLESAKTIGMVISYWDNKPIIILKSTVPPGTTIKFIKHIELGSLKGGGGSHLIKWGKDFEVIYSPEFLREGTALVDTFYPDKLIIGRADANQDISGYNQLMTSMLMLEIDYGWNPYVDMETIVTNYENAEMIKYANNAFLATKISFINEIASLCEITPGTDVNVIADAIGADHRISPHFLRAGIGFGGSCFTKDIKALINYAQRGYDLYSDEPYTTPSVLKGTLERNALQRQWGIGAIADVFFPDGFQDKHIRILGLAFKPGTDDVRDAPALDVIRQLIDWGCKSITAYDPKAIENTKKVIPDIYYDYMYEDCLNGANVVVICTEWEEFRDILTPENILSQMRTPIIIDGRRMFSPQDILTMKEKGIKYVGVGLGNDIDAED